MVAKLLVVLILTFVAPAVFMSPNPDTILRRQKRIVGGSISRIEQYPFAASLLMPQDVNNTDVSLICGCTILNTRSLLSAASCFTMSGVVNRYLVRVGSTEYRSGGILLDVTQLIPNPGYNGLTIDNDIGVIRVSPAIPLGSATIQAATLPPADISVPDNSVVVAIGWGNTSRQRIIVAISEELKSVELRVINSDRCQSLFSGTVTNKLCAGPAPGTTGGPCDGDGGGALVFNNNVVVGVTSYRSGLLACGSIVPSTFTRVSQYLTWIANNA